MALPRSQVSDGLVAELGRFEELLRSITPDEWVRPSPCDGWDVGDVARHVVGSMADVVAGNLDGLGTPEVTAREVAERRGRTADELADECAEVAKGTAGLLPLFDDTAWTATAPGGYDGTLADGVEALWYDTWMHGLDIRTALGRHADMNDSVAGVMSHLAFELAKRGWHGAIPNASSPDAIEFVLKATGRAANDGAGDPINVYA
jgi:uncharacterized protein (TIGR03083 family)